MPPTTPIRISFAILVTVALLGCSQRELKQAQDETALVRESLDQSRAELADVTSRLKTAEAANATYRKRIREENPSAYYSALTEMEGKAIWVTEGRRFLEMHPKHAHARTVRRKFAKLEKRQAAAEKKLAADKAANKLSDISIREIFANIDTYAGMGINRSLHCYVKPSRVAMRMLQFGAASGERLGFPPPPGEGLSVLTDYQFQISLCVVAGSNDDTSMSIVMPETMLSRLPPGDDFGGRLRILTRDGSKVMFALMDVW